MLLYWIVRLFVSNPPQASFRLSSFLVYIFLTAGLDPKVIKVYRGLVFVLKIFFLLSGFVYPHTPLILFYWSGQWNVLQHDVYKKDETVAFPLLPLLPFDTLLSEMYRVGELLSKYKSGKLPKAFKILPQLVNFEEILYVTEPDKWTTNAMHKATILFANNLNDRMAQRFFNTILLPAVRDDIRENNRLNFHLFSALRRALWKPAAFYKGILLPLCEV